MHEIYEEKFVALRTPGWHRLGNVVHDPISAVEGWQLMGPYSVELRPLLVGDHTEWCHPGSQTYKEVGRNGIFRLDSSGYPEELFNVVSEDYQIIKPDDFPAIWDMAAEETIETMFVLRGGRIMGITTKIDSVDINGDEVERYVMALNYFDGQSANSFVVTPVRVVCMNTLITGLRDATVDVRLNHNAPDFRKEFFDSIRHGINEAKQKSNDLKVAMELLANARVYEEDAEEIIDRVYPVPGQPRAHSWKLDTEAWENRMARHDTQVASVEATRETVLGMFYGASTTHTQATEGTAWGLYNMVCEFEDHIRTGKNAQSEAEASLFGYRADHKKRAWALAMELAK